MLGFGYPISQSELRASLGNEDGIVQRHDSVTSLLQNLLRRETRNYSVFVCSTDLHRIYWCADRCVIVPRSSGIMQVGAENIEQFEQYKNLGEGINRILREGSSLQLQVMGTR